MACATRNTSNTVQTLIEHAQISSVDGGLVKSVDKAFADIGDTLNYTIVLKNTGNTAANSVVLTDTIPAGTSLVPNSVTLNNAPLAGVNPQTGVNVGNLAPGQVATVTFSAIVTTVPAINPIPNTSKASYKYTVDPSNPNGQSAENLSNTVTTQINHGEINFASGGLVKSVDKAYADVDDKITYTIAVKNTGNTAVNNVLLQDTIPNGTELVAGTVKVNGSTVLGDPGVGINLGTVNPLTTVTVSFEVSILTIPNPNPIPNQSKVNYSYTVNPSNPNGKSGAGVSNVVTTQVNTASFDGAPKTATPAYSDIGGIVTYSMQVKNTGNSTATNVKVFDSIPNGTVLEPNSVIVNGAPQPGASPETGINVGTVAPGGVANVSFKVKVVSIPNPNPILNKAKITYNYTVDPNNPNGASGSSETGTSTNTVNSGNLTPENGGLKKSQDREYSSIGDTVTYTLKVNNVGNVPVNNLVVSDTIPKELTVVSGSITVNGSPQPGANLQTGVTIGSLNPQAGVTILFKAVVNTVPATGKIINNFVAAYNYVVDPSFPGGVNKKSVSNNVIQNVNDAVIGNGPNSFPKVSDKPYADVGDTITYTITLTNTGNVPGNNVVIKDPIPNGTSLVPNSVTLNGSQISGANPANGINIGTLNPNSQAVLVFQVKVNTIPNPNPIVNVASVSYTYTKDPSVPNGQSVSGTSTPAQSQINHGEVPAGGFTKFGDKTVVKRGDIITYTVTIPNSGNVSITNVVFTDPIPQGTALVPNSVILNGAILPGANPATGVNIGTVAPGATDVLTFQVIVNTIPASGNITNQGSISYQYIVDPNKPPVQESEDTNSSNIPVRDANINTNDGGFTKAVDKEYASLGDVVTYTLGLKNTGNVTATNVVFTDTLANGVTFQTGSVTLNGTPKPQANPSQGITIAQIGPGNVQTITFKALITTIPQDGKVPDTGFVAFNYIQDPTKPPVQGNGKSNTVVTYVNSADFTGDNFKKTANPSFVTLGDTIDYTFNIKNGGNVTANNVVFTDSLPNGVVFNPNSVVINGAGQPGANPVTGVPLGNLYPGLGLTLGFKATVVTFPSPNPIINQANLAYTTKVDPNGPEVPGNSSSNKVPNQVNSPNITVVKTSDADGAVVGDTITYTVAVKNNGNVPAENVVISDPLSPYLQFVPGSVVESGVSDKEANIISGVNIGTVGIGKTVTLSFKATLTSLPENGVATNQSTSSYEFIVDPNKPPVQRNTSSNINKIAAGVAELTLIKTANKEVIILNETLTYTVEIINTGTVTATNIIFRDDLPAEVKFVPNSFYLNNKKINGVDLEKGINIGDLLPGEKATVKYDVTLYKVCCDGTATNEAFATFNYKTGPNSKEKTKTAGPASVKVTTTSSTFKEITLDGILVVPCPKLEIEEVNELSAEVTITNYHVIKTVKGVSDENRRLTGYKLIINGVLSQTLEYTANDVVQSVHSAYFERKFSTFIILPEDYEIGTSVRIKGVVEDVYYNQLSCREVFSNITLLIDAAVLC